MSNGSPPHKALFAVTITATHFGIGRAPGVVDLPIARDPIGYPIMPASGVKGALKSACAEGGFEKGRLNCRDDNVQCCCCVFGPEPGESSAGASAASITDFSLLAMPVPSPSHGWVYVSTPYLLLRAATLLDSLGKNSLAEKLVGLADKARTSPVFVGPASGSVEIKVMGKKYSASVWENNLDELPSLSGLASKLGERLLIIPDEDGPAVIDSGIMRYWRIKLNYDTKTVDAKTGALWSEEYVPAGAVFVGAIIFAEYRKNSYCRNGCFEEVMKKLFGEDGSPKNVFFLGGKETIGKGLVRITPL